jgi:hypothetical protein
MADDTNTTQPLATESQTTSTPPTPDSTNTRPSGNLRVSVGLEQKPLQAWLKSLPPGGKFRLERKPKTNK